MTESGSGSKRKHTWTIQSSEENELTWEIEHFRGLIATNPELKDVSYYFEAGDSIGLPTSWMLYLNRNQNKLGFYLRLVEFPEQVPKVKTMLGYKTLKYCRKDTSPYEYTVNGSKSCGWSDAFFSLNDFSEDNLENGSLVINVTFSLYKDVLVDEKYKRGKFELLSRYEAAEDFQKLLDSGEDADVTFQMKDGQVLKAHANILKARSRVFSAMLQNQTQESSSGIVRIEDVTSEVMKRILTFIYSGKVEDKWEEVVEEIVYAANKYELLTLMTFCDDNLATTCTPENAWSLMDFAKLHGLKRAQGEIADYVHTHIAEILDAKLAS